MRNHEKLEAFKIADELVIDIYKVTQVFPKEEMFGLKSQIRRAAVSIPSNIVEGCGRRSEKDYLRFLEMAYGSAQEVSYQLSLAKRLGFLTDSKYLPVAEKATRTGKVLGGLIRSFRPKQHP